MDRGGVTMDISYVTRMKKELTFYQIRAFSPLLISPFMMAESCYDKLVEDHKGKPFCPYCFTSFEKDEMPHWHVSMGQLPLYEGSYRLIEAIGDKLTKFEDGSYDCLTWTAHCPSCQKYIYYIRGIIEDKEQVLNNGLYPHTWLVLPSFCYQGILLDHDNYKLQRLLLPLVMTRRYFLLQDIQELYDDRYRYKTDGSYYYDTNQNTPPDDFDTWPICVDFEPGNPELILSEETIFHSIIWTQGPDLMTDEVLRIALASAIEYCLDPCSLEEVGWEVWWEDAYANIKLDESKLDEAPIYPIWAFRGDPMEILYLPEGSISEELAKKGWKHASYREIDLAKTTGLISNLLIETENRDRILCSEKFNTRLNQEHMLLGEAFADIIENKIRNTDYYSQVEPLINRIRELGIKGWVKGLATFVEEQDVSLKALMFLVAKDPGCLRLDLAPLDEYRTNIFEEYLDIRKEKIISTTPPEYSFYTDNAGVFHTYENEWGINWNYNHPYAFEVFSWKPIISSY